MTRLPSFLAIALLTAAGCNGKSSDGDGASGGGKTGGTGGGVPASLGTLWVGGAGALGPAALIDGGENAVFAQQCRPPGFTSSEPIDGAAVVDGQGNLWSQFPDGTIGSPDSAPLYRWSASQLESCSTSKAEVFPLTDLLDCGGEGGGCNPFFSMLAFDPSGNLWASESVSVEPAILIYRASDLAGGGKNLTASVNVAASGCGQIDGLCQPIGLAFDSAGYLWIGGAYSVMAYSPATQAAILAGSDAGTPPADLVLTTPEAVSYSGQGYYAHYTFNYLAFDRAGNLWADVANGEGSLEQQIVEFSKAQLGNLVTDKTPSPALTVTETAFQRGHVFLGWEALAFDVDGNLWAGTSMFSPNLYRFSPASLADGGFPDMTLIVPGDTSYSLVFDPIPSGLPLRP